MLKTKIFIPALAAAVFAAAFGAQTEQSGMHRDAADGNGFDELGSSPTAGEPTSPSESTNT